MVNCPRELLIRENFRIEIVYSSPIHLPSSLFIRLGNYSMDYSACFSNIKVFQLQILKFAAKLQGLAESYGLFQLDYSGPRRKIPTKIQSIVAYQCLLTSRYSKPD